MPNLRALVGRLARRELDWQGRNLLAPVVAPGRATVRLDGLVYQFVIRPADRRGFGIFRLTQGGFADWVREATAREREAYLRLWPRRQCRLLREWEPGLWLAHPVSGTPVAGGHPLVVHEVARGAQFEQIEVAYDGANHWYCGPVLNTRLSLADELSAALRDNVAPEDLRLSGVTPQDRAAYAHLYRPVLRVGVCLPEGAEERHDERRLMAALARGGGALHSFTREGDHFQVRWQDSLGEMQFSCVQRDDLTVVSAGICLSDRDSDFDLTSLVGVVEEDQ